VIVNSKFFKPFPAQESVIEDSTRFKIVVAGRRFGKGNLVLRDAARKAIKYPGCRIWVVSPNYSYTGPMWDKATIAYGEIKVDGHKFLRRTKIRDKQLILYNGSIIEFKSAIEPDTLRGAGDLMQYVIFDEAAYSNREAWKAVRPALIDNVAPATFISTPNKDNPHNWFYDLYLSGLPQIQVACDACLGAGCSQCNETGYVLQDNPDWDPTYKSWHFTSYDNPFISNDEIDRMCRELGWSEIDIRREVFAEFIGGGGLVFEPEFVQNCSNRGGEEDPQIGRRYVVGVDWGKVGAYTVIIVLRIPDEEGELPHVVKLKRFRGAWPLQRMRVAETVRRYGQPWTFVDGTGFGDPLKHEVREAGVRHLQPVVFSGQSKPTIVNGLVTAVEDTSLTWGDQRQLVLEMLNLEAMVSDSGIVQYRHAKGQTDDCVMALALAWYGYLKLFAPNRPKVWARGVYR